MQKAFERQHLGHPTPVNALVTASAPCRRSPLAGGAMAAAPARRRMDCSGVQHGIARSG